MMPLLCRYKVGFDGEGRILALDVDLYNNGGQTADLSMAVMERGVSHVDNAYRVPNVHVRGHVCKTNLPSNTAFRGFGAPQAMFVAETIVDKVRGFLRARAHCTVSLLGPFLDRSPSR